MVIKIKKPVKDETKSVAELMKMYAKDYGDGIGSFGGTLPNADRIPTGILELDLAIGGGFPRGKVSMIYGPESSGKTNCALLAIANHQRMYPELTCAFVDIEHGFDPKWATKLGVDCKKLLVLKPEYAEQAVDMVEGLLFASDCGIIVMDSIAALVTASEMDSSAEKAVVGGAAVSIAKLTRKTTRALSEAEKEGRYPTLIYINQITFKIGVMFGDPETYPGGTKPKHQCSLILRLYGKNVKDPKYSDTMPVFKDTTFTLKKWKCTTHAESGKFSLTMVPYKGLKPGQSDDFTYVTDFLKSFGQFDKGPKDKGWVILGEEYNTIQDFKDRYYGDPVFSQSVKQGLIAKITQEGGLEEADKTGELDEKGADL